MEEIRERIIIRVARKDNKKRSIFFILEKKTQTKKTEV